jgi:phosphate transport system protein
MELHFDQEQTQLKEELLRMSALTDQAVGEALKALVIRDDELARKVRAGDDVIDRLQMDIDERTVALIALRQPKARDLRFLIVTMKIASELERIADQAVSLANRAIELNREPQLKPYIDVPRMAEHSRGMVHDALDAFVYAKPDLAREVIKRDERVDMINDQLYRELTSFMVEDPKTITRALNLMTVSRKLERIADHATNISEEVVYLYEGRDIRHQHE